MSADIERRLAELERRLGNIVRIGTVISVDELAARCRVKVNDLISGPLPWATDRAGDARTWWAPSIGEQVVLLSPFGDLAQGVVMKSLYQADHPAPSADANKHITNYGDGTVLTYDLAAKKLTIDCAGDVLVNAVGKVDLGAAGGPKVARVGDMVNVGSGSSAGQWPIVSGSDKVNAA